MNQNNSHPDRLLRLSGGAAQVVERRTGERPSAATMHRWTTRGLAGQKLRVQYAGGVKRTTEEWITQFFEAVTAAKLGDEAPEESSPARDPEARERAAAELEAAGI
ncbi:DUF1580 domain-containing protein [Rhodopirellula bahusiensis]|uniref:DUF1580 domain-containing protein n=1 Tax=Rhodopirellula bahusiensis TaxID=2014065 RepID=A0A2G1W5L5_9BACT|nr:DUF1580 domain-containing protein [Rhodopirellula bahusiensis]PHQ34322.1 hypothetical protein CEE69_14965 [Rhodopirellula bahusiensis]